MGEIRKVAATLSAAGPATADAPGNPIRRDFHKEDEADGATAVIATEQLVRQYLLKE